MIAALQCVYTGECKGDPRYTAEKIYPVQEAAEYDALTGQQAFRWVRIYDDFGALSAADRLADGTYCDFSERRDYPRVFRLTIG